MAQTAVFEEPGPGKARFVVLAIVALLVGLLVWFVYTSMTAVTGVKVEAPSPTVVDMLPPPPPPPPPPPEPQEKPPEPTDKPDPVPNPEPAPKSEAAPAPMTIAGPAQAGADSYGMQSGTGGGIGAPGSGGTCLGTNCGKGVGSGAFSDGLYRRQLSAALQDRIERDNKLNRLVFSADFLISIAPNGRVANVSLARSSGNDGRDAQLKAALMSARDLDPPPASVRFPQKITVRGRRSL